MKTCTQILDSGFHGNINVVRTGDSAKQASPRYANTRWNPALLLGLALPRGLVLLHINNLETIHCTNCRHLISNLSFNLFSFFFSLLYNKCHHMLYLQTRKIYNSFAFKRLETTNALFSFPGLHYSQTVSNERSAAFFLSNMMSFYLS